MRPRPLTIVLACLAFAPVAHANTDASPKSLTITATAAPWVIVKAHLDITGHVSPHPAGIQLTLEQSAGGRPWRAVGNTTVRPSGDFEVVATPAKTGNVSYRVVATAGTTFTGASQRVRVKVLHWTYIAGSQTFYYVTPLVGDLSTDPISAGGHHFDHPISLDPGCYNAWAGTAWMDFPLERRYEMFRTTVGVGDAVPTTMTLTYSIIGAGKKLASGSIVAGQSQKIAFSVEGVYRLRFQINVPDPNNAAGCSPQFPQVVFGDAELLGP